MGDHQEILCYIEADMLRILTDPCSEFQLGLATPQLAIYLKGFLFKKLHGPPSLSTLFSSTIT